MSLALLLVGLIVLIVGLPWLIAATGFLFWALGKCCHAAWPFRTLRPPV
jgi:hypothetical protein